MDTSALHAVFDLMQNHYPERFACCSYATCFVLRRCTPAPQSTVALNPPACQHLMKCAIKLRSKIPHAVNRLGMLWMYEASFLFHSIWKVVSPFIDAATKAKIKFIGKESLAELQSIIGPEVRHHLVLNFKCLHAAPRVANTLICG